MRRKFCALFGCVLSLGVASPGHALSFVFTTADGASLSPAQSAAFAAAGNAWSTYLTDNITVRLQVGFTSQSIGILGQTALTRTYVKANEGKALLIADAKSIDDFSAIASLPTTYNSNDYFTLTTAQAKALNYNYVASSVYDAVIELNSAYTFSNSRNPDGTIDAGTYDLIGVAEHEIGHALGFLSGIDSDQPTILDQFRYSSLGVSSTATGAAYFSLDDGLTHLASFADGINYEASHWEQGTKSGGAVALMNPGLVIGGIENLTLLDRRALDVIGYNIAAVPEPATWMTLILGFVVVGTTLRRRQRVSVSFA